MFEIHVTVSCPDLVAAAKLLAKCDAPKTTPSANDAAAVVPAIPAAPANTAAPAPAAPIMPVAPAVPLASAPTFTIQQIAKAGADLFTARPELRPQVNTLLANYGIQSVTDLKPEHYGAFATALRGLGAAI